MNESTALSSDAESYILRRRKFLRRCFEERGKVTQREIEDWQGKQPEQAPWSVKAIRGDIQFIRAYEDRPIFETRDGVEKFQWIDDSQKLGTTREQRRDRNRNRKLKVAELAIATVMGLQEFTFERVSEDAETKKVTIKLLDSIISQLKPYPAILKKLQRFHSTSDRTLFIDAGTTLELFSTHFLQHIKVPLRGRKKYPADDGAYTLGSADEYVSKIEAITNDREIFYRLGQQHVHARTIIVGGRQQFRSSAVSGMMAQRFLAVNELHAGAALLGCSSVRLKLDDTKEDSESCIVAENEHIAALKLAYHDRAGLTIVVADSTKFVHGLATADTKICAVAPSMIDIVLTDCADEDVRKHFRALDVPLIVHPNP